MTAGQPQNLDDRLTRLEQLFRQAGTLTLDNQERIARSEERLNRVEDVLVGWVERSNEQFHRIDQTLNRVVGTLETLTERIDSLSAASEQQSRILDYLLRRDRERGVGEDESNGTS